MGNSNKTYDVVVIGAGHNGLTNAAFLAKSGLDVLVLEKNDYIGGATVSRELEPGWFYSNCSYVCSLFRPEIYQALDLGRHGLEIVPLQGSVTFSQSGDYFGSYHHSEIRRREIARHSQRDADASIRFDADLMKWCRLIRGMLLRTPPDPTSFKPRDFMEFAFLLKKFHELSEDQIYQFIRFFTMSIAEYLEEYFENDLCWRTFRWQHYRHWPGRLLPRHGLCVAASCDGRCRWQRWIMGLCQGWHGSCVWCPCVGLSSPWR